MTRRWMVAEVSGGSISWVCGVFATRKTAMAYLESLRLSRDGWRKTVMLRVRMDPPPRRDRARSLIMHNSA